MKLLTQIIIFLAFYQTHLINVFGWILPANGRYDTSSEVNEMELNVHLVQHTHDDTGWLRTVDQYFDEKVNKIITGVVEELLEDPNRRFIYVEIAFFSRWWELQNTSRKNEVKKLVNEMRLEFVNGGWCMHDEANPTYIQMIDQTTRGHMFLRKNFGEAGVPSVGWQIDPFGHSNTQAYLLTAQAGMKSLFFGRMDYQDRMSRYMNKTTQRSFPRKGFEWIWEGSKSMPGNYRVFTGFLFGSDGNGNYGGPFSFEDANSLEVIDDRTEVDYNLGEWMKKIEDFAKFQGQYYETNHIMWTLGMDFNYVDANRWYRNLDKLVHYSKQLKGINLIYSSPSRYVDEKLKAASKEGTIWELRRDDIFPDSDGPHQYWTGYFSSRPTSKRLFRQASGFLNMARQIEFFASKDRSTYSRHSKATAVGKSFTDSLEAAVSVAMHHDGVTGTAKQHVADDYAERISKGLSDTIPHLSRALTRMVSTKSGIYTNDFGFKTCLQLNISSCDYLVREFRNGDVNLIFWNSLAHEVRVPIAIPIILKTSLNSLNLRYQQKKLKYQLLKLDSKTKDIPSAYLNRGGLTEKREKQLEKLMRNPATHELTFELDIPPLDFAHIHVRSEAFNKNNFRRLKTIPQHLEKLEEGTVLSNFFYEFSFLKKLSSRSPVFSLLNKKSGIKSNVGITVGYYVASQGNKESSQNAGAYIFRPIGTLQAALNPSISLERGEIVDVIRFSYNWVDFEIRIYASRPCVDIIYTVGPIPIGDNEGKEVVVRYEVSGIENNGIFYTDSNGRELMRRQHNSRPKSYPQLKVDEPIAQNYFPVTSWMKIRDEFTAPSMNNVKKSFNIIVDTPESGGVTSSKTASLELLLHRRLSVDDARGVGEALNETMCGCRYNPSSPTDCICNGLIARVKHSIILDYESEANRVSRKLQNQVNSPVSMFYTENAMSSFPKFPTIALSLPENIKILTLTTSYTDILCQFFSKCSGEKKRDILLLRVSHDFALGEHEELSKPVDIDIKKMLGQYFSISRCVELSISANQLHADMNFSYIDELSAQTFDNIIDSKFTKVTLNSTCLFPMQVKTFACALNPRSDWREEILIKS